MPLLRRPAAEVLLLPRCEPPPCVRRTSPLRLSEAGPAAAGSRSLWRDSDSNSNSNNASGSSSSSLHHEQEGLAAELHSVYVPSQSAARVPTSTHTPTPTPIHSPHSAPPPVKPFSRSLPLKPSLLNPHFVPHLTTQMECLSLRLQWLTPRRGIGVEGPPTRRGAGLLLLMLMLLLLL